MSLHSLAQGTQFNALLTGVFEAIVVAKITQRVLVEPYILSEVRNSTAYEEPNRVFGYYEVVNLDERVLKFSQIFEVFLYNHLLLSFSLCCSPTS